MSASGEAWASLPRAALERAERAELAEVAELTEIEIDGPRPAPPRRLPAGPKSRPERHRVCVSLTVEIHDLLRDLAMSRDCWKVEVILDALERFADELAGEAPVRRPERRRRRNRGSNPTPYVMDLTTEELERLDRLASVAAPSRSALVRRLIELEADYDQRQTESEAPAG
ncbi:MAG: hypothetical protein ACKVWR_20775 [Acidimicrobiales bacterium]